ncbi:MAG: riboflavin biosynthesis protein RibF [Blautia sp.]|nr:riboflavin biosynthesis protein RibF [Blautia sp.]
MEEIRVEGGYPHLNDTAVTLGKFDGIHRGHLRLAKNVIARKEEGKKAVLFAIEVTDHMILSHRERKALLEELGIDILMECPLTDEFRRMKAETFVSEVLVGDLGTSFVTVGEDYRFGFERKGTPQLLERLGEKYGFEVEIVPREMDGRRKISSTYVREELRLGNMEKVTSLMGRPYFVLGEVVHGQGLGHKKLLPTINMIPDEEKILPPFGVYASVLHIGKKTYQGMTNIGTKPTVGSEIVGIETNLFDCDENLYGASCRLELFHFLRPEQRFTGLDALRRQLAADEKNTREYFDLTVYRTEPV